VNEDERPLVLVVCSDAERLSRVREELRASGLLPAVGRSFAAAVALLSQVQVNGCVIVERTTPLEAERLSGALQRFSPGCAQTYVQELQAEPLEGWVSCQEAQIAQTILERLRPDDSTSP
jgi:hypothetical protein